MSYADWCEIGEALDDSPKKPSPEVERSFIASMEAAKAKLAQGKS